MNITYREQLPRTDPRLGRHVNHDFRSRSFAYQAPAKLELKSVRHHRTAPIFDQAELGRCVPSAGLGCLGTWPFDVSYRTLKDKPYPLTDAGAIQAYRDVTRSDPFPGEWEPEDTGSDGLSMAKLLQAKGAISGYQHAFSLEAALAALQMRPLITGTWWRREMFYPMTNGLVTPAGEYDGGHEYVVDEYDASRGWVGFTNSWGSRFGVGGRFYMEAEQYGALLAEDGDATVFVPLTAPAPQPQPADDFASVADIELYRKHGPWAEGWGLFTGTVRRDLRAWAEAKKLR